MKRIEKKSDVNLREERLLCGLFSRKHGAQFISAGISHVHSTLFGLKDICVQETKQALNTDKIPSYTWEKQSKQLKIEVTDSKKRLEAVDKIISELASKGKNRTNDKVKVVLEELLTNSFYHAYLDKNGRSKYQRTDHVVLGKSDLIQVKYAISSDGILISVKDQGGNLTFDSLGATLSRCYEKGDKQIEQKESGAGLGSYFILESVSHLKIVVDPGKSTTFTCWISDRPLTQQADSFSFNYFEKRKL